MAGILHDYLKKSSEQFPDASAIEYKDGSISYSELDLQSSAFSNFIRNIGNNRGDRIGLLVHKSIETYVGIYGILKSGAAYVPLDRRTPVERLAYIIDDCNIETLLVTSETLPLVEQICSLTTSLKNVIALDTEVSVQIEGVSLFGSSAILDRSLEQIAPIASIDTDLAYILYTSGSTGQPKGVMISHAVSTSFVQWAGDQCKLTHGDRVSGHAPLHFDLSVFDIFSTARSAATLLPVSDGASTFPGKLLDWIIEKEITVWYSVPSILSMMAQKKDFAEKTFTKLRQIIFAGEVFPVKYLKIWLTAFPDLSYMNWFGPTETNVIGCYTVTISPDDLDKPVPIGRSTSNAELYCVNEAGERVTEAGEVGELYARGPCVALGYWGDEEKTQQRFIYNYEQPWLKDRICKTGDLVSLDKDGNYIYQGRKDHMVKSRGYRIELGEVEAALFKYSRVSDVAVIPVPDEVIGNRLIAYVAVGELLESDLDELKAASVRALPKYMLPEQFQILEALPKTSNGKVDRQALAKQAAML